MIENIRNINWQEFEIEQIFKVHTGRDLVIYKTKRGKIPIVSHTIMNNGIVAWSSEIKGEKLFVSTRTLSLADRGNFRAFVQKKDFYIGQRVKALEAKFPKCNRQVLHFISIMINKQSVRFSYGRNATKGVKTLKILLPTKSNKEIDFDFMESFILQSQRKFSQQYLDFLSSRIASIKVSDNIVTLKDKEWKVFKIGDLFTLSQGRSKGLVHLKKTKDGINYLGATNLNNGVLCQVKPVNELIHKGNAIAFIRNGEGSMGQSVYKAESFIATSDITVGYSLHLNRFVGVFITTATPLK